PSAASNTLLVIGTPSEPRNFRVGTGPSSYQLQMGWSSPADNGGSAVTGYVIQRRTSTNGSTWSAWSTALNNTTAGNWTNTGLSGTTWYQYRVAARNAAGIGTYTAASPSVRPYYARTVRYAFGVTRMFCTYQASPQASSILGNNVWHRIQLVWPPFGLGCSAWLDLDIRWNNQEATPAPVCNMVADNQGGTFKQFQCEF